MKLLSIISFFLLTFFYTSLLSGQNIYRDNFSSSSFSRNDGNSNFSSNWIESGDNNSAYNGYIRITDGRLMFNYLWSENIRRSVDLSDASSATLSFNWETDNLDNNRVLAVQISTNGTNFTTLNTFGGTNSGNYSIDISSYISSSTTIRFLSNNRDWVSDENAYIDNFEIATLSNDEPPGCPNVLDYEFYDGVPPGLTVDNIPTAGALGRGQIGNFNVGALQNAVDPGDADTFSIRYTGYIRIATAGSYTFYTTSDDGSKLYINGTQVVNNDGDHGSQERQGTVTLTQGLHQIMVLYYENGGNEVLEVRYHQGTYTPNHPDKVLLPFTILSSDCVPPIVPLDPVNIPPTIGATGNQLYCPSVAIPIVETVSITDPDDTTIEKVFVQISSNYDNGKDQLVLTGSHPNITSSWNASEGKLTLTGPATFAAFENALRAVRFNTSATVTSGDSRNFSIVLSEANYLISTGHYYEYVPAVGITWTAARDAAAARKFYGLQGYLATIIIADEAALLGKQSSGAGWIGASDATVEGQWRWVTGPEAGTLFWSGAANGAVTAPYHYANWNDEEPNNSGNEHYAHINTPGTGFDGSWNDLPHAGGTGEYQPKGYLVEYGGMPGDPPYPQISAVTSIRVDDIAPTASNPAPIQVFCVSGIPVPNINLVTDEADNCTANPTVTFVNDNSNGGSNPEIITRTYRITDAAGNYTDVFQTITVTPLLITVQPTDQTIFAGASASFTVSANNVNQYRWQVSTNGGTSYTDLSDSMDYNGTQTNTLSVNNSKLERNGYLYRVRLSNSNSACPAITSDPAILNVQVGTVITNKRITYRVKGN